MCRGSSSVAASSICIHTAKLETIDAMRGALAERPEAQPLDVEAGQHRADDMTIADDDERSRRADEEAAGAEIGAGHDRRAIGEVERGA